MKKKIIALVAIVALIAIVAVCLTACNADSIEKKLDKAGYTVQVYDSEEDKEKGIEWVVSGSKGDISIGGGVNVDYDFVTVTKFAKTEDAKKAVEEAEESGVDEGMTIKRIGKIVYAGTEQGVKDAM